MSGLFGAKPTSTSDTKINSMRVQTSAYGLAQYLVYGKTRVAANLFWFGDFKAIPNTSIETAGGKGGAAKTRNTTHTYSASIMLGLCANPIKRIERIWIDKEQLVSKQVPDPQNENLTVIQTPIDQSTFEVFNGDQSTPWGYLESKHPDQALIYPHTAYVAAADYDMKSSASIANHNFEVVGHITLSENIDDANPADVVEDLIKNAQHGAAPHVKIGDLTEFREYCAASNLLVSLALTEQKPAHETISEIVEAVNCAVVSTVDGVKIKSFGDAPLSKNGANYTPNLEPVAHLTDDDFMDREEPIRITRSRDTDAFNNVKVEYVNRHNQYNTEIVEAKDQADIEQNGLRTDDSVKYEFFCEPSIAQHAAQLRLQRLLYVRNRYDFRLGWNYCLLEPMDIVTLTDESIGLEKFPVRIMQITEDKDGYLDVVADELAVGTRSAIDYDMQTSNGYQGGSEQPGDVYAPVIFEPPFDLTNGLNEVWVAVAGGQYWGGCNVWISIDNETYSMIGTIFGAARYGTTVGEIGFDDVEVQVQLNTVNNQILSGTTADATADATLVMIGDEYATYETATLNGQGLYTLSELKRGRFSKAISHVDGEQFVRIDRAIFKHGFNKSLVGKKIYLKFTSFNSLQAKEQTLEQVAAYSYTLKGGRTSSVRGLSLQSEWLGKVFTLQWQPVVGAAGYKVELLSDGVLIRTIYPVQSSYAYTIDDATVDGARRAYTVKVSSEGSSDYSDFAEINIANEIPDTLYAVYTSANESDAVISWIASDAPDLKDYQVWYSTYPDYDPSVNPADFTTTLNSVTVSGLATSSTYYVWVAARDVWGGDTWNYKQAQFTTQ